MKIWLCSIAEKIGVSQIGKWRKDLGLVPRISLERTAVQGDSFARRQLRQKVINLTPIILFVIYNYY